MELLINSEVAEIVGLTQRQVLSWTEKGLVDPERPAMKAGERRGYSYSNIIEFGLAKYLLDVAYFQFHTAWIILKKIKEAGIIDAIRSNKKCGLLFYTYPIEDSSAGQIRIVSSIDDLRSCRVSVAVNLDQIKKEIDEALAMHGY
jgi:hypothetical protein